MSKKIILIIVLTVVAILAFYFVLQKPGQKGEGVKIICHEPYLNPAPYTLEGIKNVIESGVYGIEFDVVLTKDRKIVVIDAPGIIRTQEGEKKVWDLTLDEVKQYRIQGLYEIPTLDEVLEEVKGKIRMAIIDSLDPITTENMPLETAVKILLETIDRKGAEDFAVIQYGNTEVLKYIDLNKYKFTLNSFPPYEFYPEYKNKIQFYTPNPVGTKMEPYVYSEVVQKYHDLGAKVISVCVKYGSAATEEPCYKPTIESGTDYIMVDYVENFKSWLKKNNIKIYGK